MGIYTIFMDSKPQYYSHINSSITDLRIQDNFNQNSHIFFVNQAIYFYSYYEKMKELRGSKQFWNRKTNENSH